MESVIYDDIDKLPLEICQNLLTSHIAHNITAISQQYYFSITILQYNRNITEILFEILQRYHSNIKMSAKINHSNIMMTYHSYTTVILSNIFM